MRPKFRAWDKENKEMLFVRQIDFMFEKVVLECYEQFFIDEVELMQSTGLRDKNGREIYEGDIVKFTLTDGFSYVTLEDGVVTYELGAFYVVNDLAEYLISDINTNKAEVIGNEFEVEVRMK